MEEVAPVFEIPEGLIGVRAPFEVYDPHEMWQLANVAPTVAWRAFRAALDVEMTWLIPEHDPIGAPMTVALREVQNTIGWALEEAVPKNAPLLNKYADLAVANNAVRRQMKLHGNSLLWRIGFTCRMALARFLWWAGGGERRQR